MTKRSIPINDDKWDIGGQFVSPKPVYELLSPAQLFKAKLNKMKEVGHRDILESASKSLARKGVEKIDKFEDDGFGLTDDAYLKSIYFHWWDKDTDPYFYWEL